MACFSCLISHNSSLYPLGFRFTGFPQAPPIYPDPLTTGHWHMPFFFLECPCLVLVLDDSSLSSSFWVKYSLLGEAFSFNLISSRYLFVLFIAFVHLPEFAIIFVGYLLICKKNFILLHLGSNRGSTHYPLWTLTTHVTALFLSFLTCKANLVFTS